MIEREEWLKNLDGDLNILSFFSLNDLLSALLFNDTEKLKEMREFFLGQVKKISAAKDLDDESLKSFVSTYKRDRFMKDAVRKEYVVKDNAVKLTWVQKRRGKK